MAQTSYNQQLSPGADISVRRLLNDLRAGDLVSSIEVVAQATTAAAALQLVIDGQIVQTVRVSSQLGYVSFAVNKRNGVDYNLLQIRADGFVFVQSVMATIQDGGLAPAPSPGPVYGPGDLPPPPMPGPDNRPHHPGRGDFDRDRGPRPSPGPRGPFNMEVHKAAYDFAYSQSGYDFDTNEAVRFADMVASRPDGAQYLSELRQLFSFARNSLSLGIAEARVWAEERVRNPGWLGRNQSLYMTAYQFAYQGSGLDLDAAPSRAYAEAIIAMPNGAQYLQQLREIFSYARNTLGMSINEARAWAERRVIEPGSIATLSLFSTAYQFAYGQSGFNMDAAPARAWAEQAVRRGDRYVNCIRQNFSYARNSMSMAVSQARAWTETRCY